MKVNHQEASQMIVRYMDAGIVPLLAGSPGLGKSGIVHQLASDLKLKVIDIRLSQSDPSDLNGFPQIKDGIATYVPFDTFPTKNTPLPEGYKGWIVFLDELTSAVPAVQAAAYKLILDRMVGQHDLHEKVHIIAAGNLDTDNAVVEPMSTALQSRLAHMELQLNYKEWLDWAADKGLDYRITSFINFKPDALYTFHPDHEEDTYACPRTWEMSSRLIIDKEKLQPIDRKLIGGVITEGVASQFVTFCKIFDDLPTMEAILNSPDTTPVPEEPSVLFALTGSLSHHFDIESAENIVQYINRMPREFQVVALRDIIRRNKSAINSQAIQNWVKANANNLF